VWNGCCFVAVVALPLVTGDGFTAGIGGGLTVSVAVFLAQAAVLLVTAGRFNRDFTTRCDPLSAPERPGGAGR
jgi:hypothetical protein